MELGISRSLAVDICKLVLFIIYNLIIMDPFIYSLNFSTSFVSEVAISATERIFDQYILTDENILFNFTTKNLNKKEHNKFQADRVFFLPTYCCLAGTLKVFLA